MIHLNWRKATREQLNNIANLDHDAPLEYRIAAAAELKRRNRRKYGRLNYKLKPVYKR